MEINFSGIGAWLEQNTALIASAAGAASSAYFTEVKTWREKVACVILGIVTSVFISDPIYGFLPSLGEKATCFLTGFFGLNICAAFLKSVRRFGDDADFWVLFKELVTRIYERYIPVSRTDESGKD